MFNIQTVRRSSVGFIVKGCAFPSGGFYDVSVRLLRTDSQVILSLETGPLFFFDTKDILLRFAPYFRFGMQGFPPPFWQTDIAMSMQRLNVLMPVRDGVGDLDGDTCSGVRYLYDTQNPVNWAFNTCTDFLKVDLARKQTPGVDHVQVSVLYRTILAPPETTVDGRFDIKTCNGVAFPWCQVVGGTPPGQIVSQTFAVVAEETGHAYGLEPRSSPYWDPNQQDGHSKINQLPADPYAFDFWLGISPPPGTFDDPMGFGGAAPSVALNVFDWNYLLTSRFPKLSSTGTESHPCSCHFVPPNPSFDEAQRDIIIGSRADGPLIVLGPGGPVPVPGRDGPRMGSRIPESNHQPAFQSSTAGINRTRAPTTGGVTFSLGSKRGFGCRK